MAIIKTKKSTLKKKVWIYFFISLFVLVLSYYITILTKENFYLFVGICMFLYFNKKRYIYGLGYKGEKKVIKTIKKNLNNKYVLYNDINLWNNYTNRKTQIDHILIGEHLIFCIETKNYKGEISGNQYNQTWQIGYYKNKLKIKEFYNPVKQNYTHVKVLEETLKKYGINNIPIINLVVFANKEVLLNVNVNSKNVRVVKIQDMIATIREMDSIINNSHRISAENKVKINKIIETEKLN